IPTGESELIDIQITNQGEGSKNKRGEEILTSKPPEGKKKKRKLAFSEKPQMEREAMPYSIVSDLLHLKSNITIGQLMNIPQYKNEVKKVLTPKQLRKFKNVKRKSKEMLMGAATSNTPMTCKGQVSQWVID